MIARPRLVRAARLAAVLVVACALLAYAAALAGAYVFDDLHSISDNTALRDLGNLGRYWYDPSAFSVGAGTMYRPVLLTSFALNQALGAAAWSLKAGNVLLHASVAALLFGWLWRTSRRLRASAVVALLFAAHPLASEAVNLVSARSELLATFGMLVALHAHLSWQRGSRSLLAVAGMVIGAVVACGSKETGVVVPFVCAAQALWLRQRRWQATAWKRVLVGLLPMLGVAAAYLIARKVLLGQATVSLLDRAGGDPLTGHGRTLVVQLATMGTLLPGALLQAVLPCWLSIDPPIVYRESFASPAVLVGWATMLVLTALALRPGPSARLRRIGAVLAWSVALPWIVVPLNMPLAEHRLYGPLVGLAAIAVAGAPWLWRRCARAMPAAKRVLPVFGGGVLVLAIAASAVRSLQYRDESALWRAALARDDSSFRSWWGLGTCTLRAGDVAGAIAPLARAHELNPTHYDTLRNYVEALVLLPDAQADPERSLAVAAEIAAIAPRDPWVRTLQAQAHMQAGRVRGSREHFEQAEQLALSCLQIATPKGYVYRLAAEARRGLGDLEGALAHLDASIARGLHACDVRIDRAAVLRELGRPRDAQRELLQAQREAPGDPAVMNALLQLAAPAAPR